MKKAGLILLVLLIMLAKLHGQQYNSGQYFGFGGLNYNTFPADLFFTKHYYKAFQFEDKQFTASWQFNWGIFNRFEYRSLAVSLAAGLNWTNELKVKYNDFLEPGDEYFSQISSIELEAWPSVTLCLPPSFLGRYYIEGGYKFNLPFLHWEDITDNVLDENYTRNTVKSLGGFDRLKGYKTIEFGLMGESASIGLNYAFCSYDDIYISNLRLIVRIYFSGSRLRKDKIFFQ
jgi:hypothetical protein